MEIYWKHMNINIEMFAQYVADRVATFYIENDISMKMSWHGKAFHTIGALLLDLICQKYPVIRIDVFPQFSA